MTYRQSVRSLTTLEYVQVIRLLETSDKKDVNTLKRMITDAAERPRRESGPYTLAAEEQKATIEGWFGRATSQSQGSEESGSRSCTKGSFWQNSCAKVEAEKSGSRSCTEGCSSGSGSQG